MWHVYFFVVSFSLLHAVSAGSSHKLPKGFKVCRRSDTEIEECLADAIKTGIQLLKDGSNELGLYPLDPLRIEKLVMEQGRSDRNFRLSMKLFNATFQNHSDIDVTLTRVDMDKLSLRVKTYSPYSRLAGQYEMRGQMLLLPVMGSGPVDMEFKGLAATMQVDLEQVKKSGSIYLKPRQVKFKLQSFKNIKVNFKNLFRGNKALSDTINKALNDNWEGVVEAFKPSIDIFFSTVVSDIVSRVFGRVPYDQILPP